MATGEVVGWGTHTASTRGHWDPPTRDHLRHAEALSTGQGRDGTARGGRAPLGALQWGHKPHTFGSKSASRRRKSFFKVQPPQKSTLSKVTATPTALLLGCVLGALTPLHGTPAPPLARMLC